jgi:hypothetical protein
MSTLARRIWRRVRGTPPTEMFSFDRPIVVLQSDDWGRIGLRDQEGLQLLRAAGLKLGERPYDFYTLETAEDVDLLSNLLRSHCDSTGRPACLGMNFVVSNLDFAQMHASAYREIALLALADGLPHGWNRPGLFEAYRRGIAAGVFVPTLHGTTHFCRKAVERHLADPGERGVLLRTLWDAGTPYIYWRMPWIGYEFWEPEAPKKGRFLDVKDQTQIIGAAVGMFSRMFSSLPRSACAPGYRANVDTHRAWSQYGIRVAQSGPDPSAFPCLDQFGILHLHRNVEFEPAIDPNLSVESCVHVAEDCITRGMPVVISMHSINLHSSIKDYRSNTLRLLHQFLTALESKYPDLLYLHDEDLYQLVSSGTWKAARSTPKITVTKWD